MPRSRRCLRRSRRSWARLCRRLSWSCRLLGRDRAGLPRLPCAKVRSRLLPSLSRTRQPRSMPGRRAMPRSDCCLRLLRRSLGGQGRRLFRVRGRSSQDPHAPRRLRCPTPRSGSPRPPCRKHISRFMPDRWVQPRSHYRLRPLHGSWVRHCRRLSWSRQLPGRIRHVPRLLRCPRPRSSPPRRMCRRRRPNLRRCLRARP